MTTELILTNPSEVELAAAVEENLFALFRTMAATLPKSELVEGEKLSYHLTFPSNPMFKGVWRTRLSAAEVDNIIDETLDWFKARQAPFIFWWTGPGTTPSDLGERLAARGLLSIEAQTQELAPGLVSTGLGASAMVADLYHMNETVLTQVPPGFTIEEVRDEASLYNFKRVFLESYEASERAAQAWVEATLCLGFGCAPWQMYLGRLNGEPVATNMLFNGGGVAGVYTVGTLPLARGQGIGGAITLKPLLAAREMGYRYAVLFASEMGIHAYERIGFRRCGIRLNRYLWYNPDLSNAATMKHLKGHYQLDNFLSLTNLTPFQFQFWIGQKLEPEKSLFNLTDTFTIAGPINPEHFQKAFQTLIDLTDALRTVIEDIEGVPQQRVVDRLLYELEYVDLSEEMASQTTFQAWLQRRSQTPFDLERCLFDSALLKISVEQFIWYLNIHHIVSDGWSFYLIFQRMQELYQRSLEGRLNEPMTFPSFQDFADDERAYRRSPQYLADKAYWEKKLATEAQPLTFYGQSPAKQSASVRRISYELGVERTRRLKAMTRQDRFTGKTVNVSLYNILVGVFSTYLYRITGNDYFSIGTPFLNRSSSAFRDTVGLFMQVVPLRIIITEDDTFGSLIERVRAESAATSRHYRYTLRNYQNSLYDVIFNYHNISFSSFNGLPTQEEWIHSGNDGHSFSLHVRYPEAESLLLQFDFHSEVFDEKQQARAVEHFLRLLDAFLENPDQLINRVNLLSEAEKQRVLVTFNQTEAVFSENTCIHELFQAQVEQTPEAIAVVQPTEDGYLTDEQRLTYRELNSRANQLAHYLRKCGVEPEVLVGICMERSIEMMVGILGILKAGGAYVPLDPTYPRERLAFIIEDTQMSVLLTQRRLVETLPPKQKEQIICLDADWPVIRSESMMNPRLEVKADNLAYVIYTSGSTGTPKGVMVEHRALVNYTEAAKTEFKLSTADRVLQFASISFDTSGEEIYPCLSSGSTLFLRTDSMLSSTQKFLETCQAWELTSLDLPTAYWHDLTTNLDVEQLVLPPSIRLVIIGGEKVLPEQLSRWQKCVGRGVQLLNTYGPTEATIVATTWELPEPAELETVWAAAPIGRPIQNVQIYVLDQLFQPVPIGVPGELFIGGVGLARGYLNQPELTGERFISYTFKDIPVRLYKSGDMVRRRPDGSIEYLGRSDHQVKIQGFRIELGEIEAVLGQHPAVGSNVVIVREDEPGNKRLVAYFVPKQAKTPVSYELRSYLKEKLPDYMLPSLFVALESLPLTPNGKIDRSALPKPDMSRSELGQPFVAPRTAVEQQVAEIWAQLLNLEQVGLYDNFFELGGHSLLATRAISRLRDTFQVALPLRSLFEVPHLAALAKGIEALRWSGKVQRPESDAITPHRELGEL